MDRCEVCGNAYDKLFQVTFSGVTHEFDSFECAIQALAPSCHRCGCRILGHGVERAGIFYCGASCSRMDGTTGARDRIA